MDYKEEITKLKGRVEALEALIGKNAPLTPPMPGATFEVTHKCGDKQVYTPVPNATAEAIEKSKEDLAARDCPKCETRAAQKRRIADGVAEMEGRPRDSLAVTHAIDGRR